MTKVYIFYYNFERMRNNLRTIILIAVVIGTPLFVILIIQGWYYALWTKECYSSTENLIECRLVRNCHYDRRSECFDEITQVVSEIVARAWRENDPQACKEIKRQLQFICDYKFAQKLEFTLDEVFINNMKDQGFNLCIELSGPLRKKCFFNLALEQSDPKYCHETGDLKDRCTESVSFIWNNINQEDLFLITKSRLNPEAKRLNIKFDHLLDIEEYLVGERGRLKIYNGGSLPLEGKKFNLYKNMRLVDIDGCREESLIYPLNVAEEGKEPVCKLDFSTKAEGLVLEVTYDGKTVLVDPGCTTRSCEEQYHR